MRQPVIENVFEKPLIVTVMSRQESIEAMETCLRPSQTMYS